MKRLFKGSLSPYRLRYKTSTSFGITTKNTEGGTFKHEMYKTKPELGFHS
ncbi:MAG: hypothetical protein LBJ00_01235 [Planctomycetaceae bacterium]|nr:hypothetical protein [Planctomycetaceae bacterium]